MIENLSVFILWIYMYSNWGFCRHQKKSEFFYIYKDLFTHKDINTYINAGVDKNLFKYIFLENTGFQKKREKICKIMHK